MTENSMQHSHYWVFNEAQLEQVIEEYLQKAPTPLLKDAAYETILAFLHSDACVKRGMRRGGCADEH